MPDYISLRGCRLHNLKNIDVDVPLGKVTVVCGPSGCGKSTLVLDTLHGESKRRYLETLSPFAADMLGGKRNIPLTSAEGLPASIAIGPTRGEASAKAYALSIAECDNALRTLFAAFAKPACPVCGAPMESETREQIIKIIAAKEIGTKLQFLAPMETAGNSLDKLSAAFLSQGYTRAIADGTVYSLADLLPGEKVLKPKKFAIVVDRIIVRENTRTRIAEAVDATLKLTHSTIELDVSGTQELYSTQPRCKNTNDKQHKNAVQISAENAVPVLEARSFSPYNRTSACPCCEGTGLCTSDTANSASTSVNDDDSNDEVSGVCPQCQGFRLKNTYLNASIDGTTFANILSTPFSELPAKFHALFDGKILDNLKPTFRSLLDRCEAINDLGIGYLTAGRAGQTLSGGEMQRLKLASLSTGHLNGLLVALDEPASGLHETDVDALWNVLEKVKARGNTLVLIEHNPGIIRRADYLIEMGPGAGEKGGQVLFQGSRDEVLENPESPTGTWLKQLNKSKKLSSSKSAKSANSAKPVIQVRDFSRYDMVKVNADFPINKFSVITGQSGSGKSTLLFQNLARRAHAGEFQPLGIEALSILSTGDFHGSRRSTILSAIDLMSKLRDLFAKLPESKVRGYNATKFSMHTPGGRCENCKGEGVLLDPSGFEETECPVCLGRRFRDEVLEVRFKSLSIADILDMEVGSAYKLFANLKPFAEKLKPLVDTGLDYLRLGQTTSHLSGGERARLRLSIALARAKAPNTLFLFDEPARGLHQKDIHLLLDLIRGLCDAGHTVIAIEHAQDFVNAADYAIELRHA
ncbi:MAG: ABC transporter [Fibrobacter sp.]|nr:ABC transporter [Fibrobacter sp.]